MSLNRACFADRAINEESQSPTQSSVRLGCQKRGHTWHIVPRNYSLKVGLKDYIKKKIERMRGKEEEKKSEELMGFNVELLVLFRCAIAPL